jgi:hypothetical protein
VGWIQQFMVRKREIKRRRTRRVDLPQLRFIIWMLTSGANTLRTKMTRINSKINKIKWILVMVLLAVQVD